MISTSKFEQLGGQISGHLHMTYALYHLSSEYQYIILYEFIFSSSIAKYNCKPKLSLFQIIGDENWEAIAVAKF